MVNFDIRLKTTGVVYLPKVYVKNKKMVIESKFELGQEVWYIDNSLKATKGKIFCIEENKTTSLGNGHILYDKIKTESTYKYWLTGKSLHIKEAEYLFKTKEELIQSL